MALVSLSNQQLSSWAQDLLTRRKFLPDSVCKPSLSETGEVRDPRKESTITTAFLNPYTSNYILYTMLIPASAARSPHQTSLLFFSSQQEREREHERKLQVVKMQRTTDCGAPITK